MGFVLERSKWKGEGPDHVSGTFLKNCLVSTWVGGGKGGLAHNHNSTLAFYLRHPCGFSE